MNFGSYGIKISNKERILSTMERNKIPVGSKVANKVREIIADIPDTDLLNLMSIDGIVEISEYYGGTTEGDKEFNQGMLDKAMQLLLVLTVVNEDVQFEVRSSLLS